MPNLSFICHRVNRIEQLKKMKEGYGAEIDLRSKVDCDGEIHLHHDAWQVGDSFEEWLAVWGSKNRGTLILNTKEDGLENRVFELLMQYQVKDYFFLDTALPTLVKWTQFLGNRNFAQRLSQFEPLELVAQFRGKAEWLWVDCFGGVPLPADKISPLKKDFKICLVSPELQGKNEESLLSQFSDLAKIADAICTKVPEVWQRVVLGSTYTQIRG